MQLDPFLSSQQPPAQYRGEWLNFTVIIWYHLRWSILIYSGINILETRATRCHSDVQSNFSISYYRHIFLSSLFTVSMELSCESCKCSGAISTVLRIAIIWGLRHKIYYTCPVQTWVAIYMVQPILLWCLWYHLRWSILILTLVSIPFEIRATRCHVNL